MQRTSLLLALVLVVNACTDAPPGPTQASVEQDVAAATERLMASTGGQLVLEAIEAHGGLAAWYGAPTSAYTWEYANVGANLRFKSYLVADNRTRQVYHDLLTLGTYEQAAPTEGQFAWDGQEAWIYPPEIEQINPRFWATTGYYFESIPFILADPGLTYDVLPADTLGGQAYDMVRVGYGPGVGDSPDDTYTLYIHPDTRHVDAIRYTVTYGRGAPSAGAPLRETLFYYEDYVTVDGLTVATHFRGFNMLDGVLGDFKNAAWADSISFRQPFDASRLTMPQGARIQAFTPPS